MPDKKSFLDRLHKHLFDQDYPAKFDKDEQEMIIRYRALYTMWLSEPMTPKRMLVDYLINDHNVSEATAYRDVSRVELLLGNVSNASKNFYTHAANEMLKDANHRIINAKTNFEIKQAEAIIKVANSIGDINRLKINDPEEFIWDEIKPVLLEVTDDVEAIGIKRKIPQDQLEAYKNKVRRKYNDSVQDVEFEDLSSDGD